MKPTVVPCGAMICNDMRCYAVQRYPMYCNAMISIICWNFYAMVCNDLHLYAMMWCVMLRYAMLRSLL